MTRLAKGEALATFARLVALETDDCVLWPGARTSSGYGHLWIEGGNRRVHIMACEHHHGLAPSADHLVAHQPNVCHERACMNYRHLRWATRSENEEDKVLDGTHSRGTQHGQSKLTDEQVRIIRAARRDGASLRALGREHGVHHTTILAVTVGTTWSWLDTPNKETHTP